MGSGDYNSGGFTQGGDGTVFGDPSSDPGSIQDYNTWDWKQIEAAINGMSAGVDSSANSSHAKSVSDPQSLQDAADIFYQVQVVLSGVAQALTDQAKALAGDNGPWKGDAADSFLTMMETFSKQVSATAAALSGGTSGLDSVPQQLANNAVNLVNAQNLISEIDTYYANEAVKSGVTPMSNGLIPISQRPQLVEWMNEDMRAVLKSLAGEYQVTIDSVRSPGPVNSPLGSNQPPPTDTGPNQPNFQDTNPGSVNPDLSGLRTADSGLPLTPMNLDTTPRSAGGPDLKSLDPSRLAQLGGNPSGLGTGPGIGALSPNALDRALNPSAYSGGLGTGGTGGLDPLGLGGAGLLPSAFGGGLGTGGKGGLPAEKSAIKSSAFPGSKGVGGAGAVGGVGGLGAAKPGKLSTGDGIGTGGLGAGQRFPGSTSLESGLPGTGSGTAEPGLGAAGGLGEGMPYMPGMGGGAGQAAGHNGERSDASGLLDASGKPWAGGTNVGGDIGHHLGTAAGGEGLSLPTEHAPGLGANSLPGAGALAGEGAGAGSGAGGALGEGMPYMPGMGGGAGQAAGHNGERSDASGLLAASAAPWEGEAALGGEVGSHLGTAAGGEGLGLPGAAAEGATVGSAEQAGEAAAEAGLSGEGVPFLPGTGGAAGQAAGAREGERSEASGLLAPSADPWSGDPAETEPDTQATAAGGEGLALTIAAAAALAAVAAGPSESSARTHETQSAAPVGEASALTATTAAAGNPGTPATTSGGEAAAAAAAVAAEATGHAGTRATTHSHTASDPTTATAAGVTSEATGQAGTGATAFTHSGQAATATGASTGGSTALPGATPTSAGAVAPPAFHAVSEPPTAAAGSAAWQATAPHGTGTGPAGSGAAPTAPAPDQAAGPAAAAGPVGGHPGGQPAAHAAPRSPRPTNWTAGAGVDEEADFAEVELAEPAAGPALLGGEAAAGWDGAGAAFVPLLWSVPVQEEGDVHAPGYATTEQSAWGDVPAPRATAAQPDEEEPRFATWRPNRAIVTTSSEGGGTPVVYRSSAADDFEEEPAPEPETEEPAEEKPGRGAADLLVQESDTWGVAADDDFDAII
ncbi:WXG100 family type VII secretion target [Streptacidiphilus jiangxiensis]|uniref:WXG100 family type VII secretion target n=1 Tax=Streptacidiphilus jiangxiensis TaxID=235985 RepID=A0A1H7P6U3_STRJI|nr:WXG100 family type VII secretion target [Streptacidiphilus jiangxiensis]SEL30975.1 hypothetical protein SAMN05414137_107229 [Streptacidiphilus jiangxiensis]